MALTICKDCNTQISNQAKACPKCGAPQKKSNTWILFLIIILIAGVVGFIYLYPQDDRTERIAVAKEILRNNKNDIVELTTTKVDNSFAKFAISLAADISCNCIIDSLSIKLADKYSLSKLNEIRVQPLNNLKEISTLIIENEAVCTKCLTFQN